MNQCVQTSDLLMWAVYGVSAIGGLLLAIVLTWLVPKLKWMGIARIDVEKIKSSEGEKGKSSDAKTGGSALLIWFMLFAFGMTGAVVFMATVN